MLDDVRIPRECPYDGDQSEEYQTQPVPTGDERSGEEVEDERGWNGKEQVPDAVCFHQLEHDMIRQTQLTRSSR